MQIEKILASDEVQGTFANFLLTYMLRINNVYLCR